MKPLLCICFLFTGLSAKSPWTVKGKVGIEQKGSEVGFQLGLLTEYEVNDYLHWRTDFNLGIPQLENPQYLRFGIPTNLLWSPFGRSLPIRPYFGPGIGYVFDTRGAHQFSTNGLAGIEFEVNKKVFGIEARYTMNDWSDPAQGSWDFALSSQWLLEF